MKVNFVFPDDHELSRPSTDVAQNLFELGAQIATAAA
jgi:hypothetical protein